MEESQGKGVSSPGKTPWRCHSMARAGSSGLDEGRTTADLYTILTPISSGTTIQILIESLFRYTSQHREIVSSPGRPVKMKHELDHLY